ncbi:putative membrane protein YhiD involved in acid resistance [Sphingomonas sp. SORGH_AS 879]|nr:putative membrane protein YhiD involved in acid resistance [Sphingomonas sp. SORGH_AS_0879]
MNTAATLWCSAAVGSIAGSDMVAEAVLLTFVVLLANTALRPLVDAINRIPVEGRHVEATYSVSLTTVTAQAGPVGDMLVEHLERAGLPVAELETEELGEDQVTVTATLTSTIIEAGELDRITDHFQSVHGISHATWAASTHD